MVLYVYDKDTGKELGPLHEVAHSPYGSSGVSYWSPHGGLCWAAPHGVIVRERDPAPASTVKESLTDAPAFGKWIRAGSSPRNTPILVCAKRPLSGEYECFPKTAHFDGWSWVLQGASCNLGFTPTHWMPLPDAPE